MSADPGVCATGLYDLAPLRGLRRIGRPSGPGAYATGLYDLAPLRGLTRIGRRRQPGAYATGLYDLAPLRGLSPGIQGVASSNLVIPATQEMTTALSSATQKLAAPGTATFLFLMMKLSEFLFRPDEGIRRLAGIYRKTT